MKKDKRIKPKRIVSLLLVFAVTVAMIPAGPFSVTEEAFAVQNDNEVKVDGGVKLGGYGSTSFYYDCDTKTVCNTAPESGSYALEQRLKLRDTVKETNPGCKIVLIVDENSEKEVARKVRQAKKDGRIDQFIYGSISASYLVALMDTL